MRPKIKTKYGNMEEIISFWPSGKLKSITHFRNGVLWDRSVYDRDGKYKYLERINPIEECTTENLEKKKNLVCDLIHLYINSLTFDELKNQLVENLAGDCEDDQHDYLVDLVEEKFGESVESLHKRTNGGRIR